MKKKTAKTFALLLLAFLALLLIWNLTDCATVYIGEQKADLSFSESWKIRSLLSAKKYEFIQYGCPFSENYSVKVGGLTYCIATDDCNTIFIRELNIYYTISPNNKIDLENMMLAHG